MVFANAIITVIAIVAVVGITIPVTVAAVVVVIIVVVGVVIGVAVGVVVGLDVGVVVGVDVGVVVSVVVSVVVVVVFSQRFSIRNEFFHHRIHPSPSFYSFLPPGSAFTFSQSPSFAESQIPFHHQLRHRSVRVDRFVKYKFNSYSSKHNFLLDSFCFA